MVISDGIEIIRIIVAFWTSTPKRVENFEKIVCRLQISWTKKLVLG